MQFTVSATDVDGNTLTYSASDLPSGATFNTSTESFSWTPVNAGVNSITFTVSDGNLSASQNVTIDVEAASIITSASTPSPTQTTTESHAPAWDVNGDHVCNILDVIEIGLHFNKSLGDPGYAANCDVDGNGVININDIIIVGLHWNQTW